MMPTALVTGATQGLGRALAEALAVRGWDLVVTARDADRLAETVSALGDHGHDVVGLAGDVSDAVHRDDVAHVVTGPAVNVVAAHSLTCSLLPSLEATGGTVLAISSDAGVEHYETWGAYGASKAALDHLTLTLGAEVPSIRAYALDPGDMRTAMHQAAFPGEDIGDRPLPEEVAVPGIMALL